MRTSLGNVYNLPQLKQVVNIGRQIHLLIKLALKFIYQERFCLCLNAFLFSPFLSLLY